ncbi:hypothetical protein LTR53_002290 [Teratosphaeriaceae sp. CCFEE 6253]|nr:hypothetical protein LTR53_002290 [Teratosphaeriaceae sp. CCFEE 6253]
MAMRRAIPEEWIPSPTTKICTRSTREPREERARLPKSVISRDRPALIRLLSPPDSSSIASPPLPFKDTPTTEYGKPREPEIVDLAVSSTWLRRGPPAGPPPKRAPVPPIRIASPSVHSRYSTAGQSEISFGILDYYTREPSPLPSPDLPGPPPPPKVDAAMKHFDFQLAPTQPGPQKTAQQDRIIVDPNNEAKAGAQEETRLVDIPLITHSEQPLRSPPAATHKRTYSLFPVTKETSPTAAKSTASPQSPTMASPTGTISSSFTHQAPDPSYRPRKQSLSSSIRSRKDSFTSFRSNRRIPLRILSSASSTPSATARTASISTASPPERLLGHHSRWSDESTILSPTAAATPNGLRTSFGSLLNEVERTGRRSESGMYHHQYPACFFEDDEDESAPLRKKFGWARRSTSLTVKELTPLTKTGGRVGRGRFDERAGWGEQLRRVMLCGGCGGKRSQKTRRSSFLV